MDLAPVGASHFTHTVYQSDNLKALFSHTGLLVSPVPTPRGVPYQFTEVSGVMELTQQLRATNYPLEQMLFVSVSEKTDRHRNLWPMVDVNMVQTNHTFSNGGLEMEPSYNDLAYKKHPAPRLTEETSLSG